MKLLWRRLRAWFSRLIRVRVADRGFPLLLIVAYVTARTAGGVVPVLAFSFLLSAALICFFWTRALGFSLSVIHECERYRIERGQPMNITLRVENEGFVPAPWVRVTDHTGNGAFAAHSEVAELSPLSTLVRTYSVGSLGRGRYYPGPVTLTSGDPLGLFVTSTDHRGYRQLVVYPRIRKWPAISLPLRQPFGRFRTGDLSLQDPSSLAGIREFRSGDSPRHIDWKATARRGQVQVRQFDLTATGSLHLLLDLSAEQSQAGFERAVEAAASLGALAAGRGLELSLLARGGSTHHLPPGRGHGQAQALMEILAAVRADSRPPLHQVLAGRLNVRPYATLCVLTSHLGGPTAGQLLARLARGPVALFHAGSIAPALSRRLVTSGLTLFVISADGMPVSQEGASHAVRA